VQQESKKNKQKKSFWFLRFLFEKKAKHKKLENINVLGFLRFYFERKQNAKTKKEKYFWGFEKVN
jgi:hypothetical protein